MKNRSPHVLRANKIARYHLHYCVYFYWVSQAKQGDWEGINLLLRVLCFIIPFRVHHKSTLVRCAKGWWVRFTPFSATVQRILLNKNKVFKSLCSDLSFVLIAKAAQWRNMTNVKLIIYLSRAATTNVLFIYVSQLFHVIAKTLPRVMSMQANEVEAKPTGAKGTFLLQKINSEVAIVCE